MFTGSGNLAKERPVKLIYQICICQLSYTTGSRRDYTLGGGLNGRLCTKKKLCTQIYRQFLNSLLINTRFTMQSGGLRLQSTFAQLYRSVSICALSRVQGEWSALHVKKTLSLPIDNLNVPLFAAISAARRLNFHIYCTISSNPTFSTINCIIAPVSMLNEPKRKCSFFYAIFKLRMQCKT